MITDEMLCIAAAESSAAYIRYLEQDFDPEHQHEFSQRFEKKIKRLCRRANHPFLYRSLQRVASFFLAALIGGAVWLSVDIEARAAFFEWVKELYENYIVYKFETDSSYNASVEEYRPTWLPEGYKETGNDVFRDTVTVLYINNKGQGMIFSYSNGQKKSDWFIDQSSTVTKYSQVNQMPADLYINEGSGTANSIVWLSADNTAFYISAFLNESDLIKMAESVKCSS